MRYETNFRVLPGIRDLQVWAARGKVGVNRVVNGNLTTSLIGGCGWGYGWGHEGRSGHEVVLQVVLQRPRGEHPRGAHRLS